MLYFEIVVRDQNLQFQVLCQRMAIFEQLNDHVLDTSSCELFKIIKSNGSKNPPKGLA